MASVIDRNRTIQALEQVWTSLSELLGGLSDDQWATPSPLPGWNVQDNVAHILGTEAMLLDVENPRVAIDREAKPHVHNDIGEFNEVWVEYLRPKHPSEVLSLFREYTASRLLALEGLSDVEWHAESFTPAGKDTYGRFMQIRVFDCWLHEQDIRDAVGVPGHHRGPAVDVTLDEMATALGFVVGKKARVDTGQSVTFELTDGGETVRTLHVAVGERAAVVDALDGPATTTLTMPLGVMTRLCAGRIPLADVRDEVRSAGDDDVADRVLTSLNYTI